MLKSILSTKLYIPEMRSDFVIRQRLIEKLTDGINKNSRLTLVSAPAGYGKTTLVLELIKSMGIKSSWVSLDDADNDPVRFISYFIAALGKAGVKIGSDTEGLAGEFSLSSLNALMSMIINDIASFSERIILVLDDFHLIYSVQLSDAIRFLVEHQPPNFHLVIITREDPKLPLSRLRVRGELNEIRVEDLRFDRDETGDFFRKAMDLSLDKESVEAFNSRTEGWIAGLQLAGLSLKGCRDEDVKNFVREFNGTHRYIIDYLVDEVLGRQDIETRDFLCKTSILERMSGELCDAVAQRKDSKTLLRGLEEANLFIIPLDEKREWYRYHHLFADSLKTELSREEEKVLHKRAALWFEENGFKHEAVKHAFKSGDTDMTVKLVENSTEQLFKDAQLSTLVKWLDMLPEDLIKSNEIFSVRKAWALYIIGRINDAASYMKSLGDDFIEKTTPQNKGLFLSLQARFTQYTNPLDSEYLAEEALRFLEPWDPIARISTMNTLGGAQTILGKTKDSNKTFMMSYNEGMKFGYAFVTTLALLSLGNNLNLMGRRKQAIELYSKYIDGMTQKFQKPLPYIGIVYVGLSLLYYEGNELENARQYLLKGLDLCRGISLNWGCSGDVWTALIGYAMGEGENSIDLVKKAFDVSIEMKSSRDIIICIDALTSMLFRNGEHEDALAYKDSMECWMENTPAEVYEQASISLARILIYNKETGKAVGLLQNIEKAAEESQRIRKLITVQILLAAACCIDGDRNKMNMYMDRALALAEENGYLRPFLDEEPIVSPIIASRKNRGEFEDKLSVHFSIEEGNFSSNGEEARAQQVFIEKFDDEYIEKLSPREEDILRLIGRGMSNSDIAKELFISTNTTQWHISHIYSKLGVKSRTQAIIKAKELGIM